MKYIISILFRYHFSQDKEKKNKQKSDAQTVK
jgi:hypothetical protein